MSSVTRTSSPLRVEYVATTPPLGPCIAAASPRGICWLALGDDADVLCAALLRRFPGAVEVRSSAGGLLAGALAAVEAAGVPCDMPLDLRGTPFQLAVWAELRRIPAGSVITYAELARRVGRPRAYRAVAQACGANPVGVLVPCHRVVASSGGLGGFGFGLARKAALLQREGVRL
ncbi:MAG: methylated-DNA--[protein]-cysteine S-methyltransferase [Betaproteobacteria bacterium]|nr:methylated-DNA--[protein]-cysteine S-methyltransferase [Betaproteobacteria bacterium]